MENAYRAGSERASSKTSRGTPKLLTSSRWLRRSPGVVRPSSSGWRMCRRFPSIRAPPPDERDWPAWVRPWTR
eukprot:scaffold22960_cov58-Phaeocystis_antarctica.AAC.5